MDNKHSLLHYYNFHTWMSLGDCSWAMTLEQNSQQVNLCSVFLLLHLYVESVFIQTGTSSLQALLSGSPLHIIPSASQGEDTEEAS